LRLFGRRIGNHCQTGGLDFVQVLVCFSHFVIDVPGTIERPGT
jgi:hypothetical protein